MSVSEAQSFLGFVSSLMPAWDAARWASGGPRHHLRHASEVEAAFWSAHQGGAPVATASGNAGVGRSTGYRWLQARFGHLRQDRVSVAAAARVLRLDVDRAAAWEAERRRELAQAERSARAAHHGALVSSLQHAQVLAQPRSRGATQDRHARYWRLIEQGHSNADACAIMSIHPRTGRRIRRRGTPRKRLEQPSGRYLLLVERLQIADLRGQGLSLRAIAAELRRSVSTVSRELARHRDEQGRYQPYQAEHAATQQRRRPRAPKLLADDRLRELVQRKLNLYWSPQQISGWLRVQHPHDPTRVVCHETIYRALIVPGGRCLHSRYTAKLRTGRKLRRSHYDTRSHKDGAVRNMTMISDRPVEVHDRVQPGRPEERAEARHRQDDGGLGVQLEGGSDLGVHVLDADVEGQDAGGELGDDPGGDLLAGEHDVLGAGGGDCPVGELGVAADMAGP